MNKRAIDMRSLSVEFCPLLNNKKIMKKSHVAHSVLLSAAIIAAPAPELIAQASGQTSSPQQLVDALHAAFGEHQVRAVHARGIILEGVFTPDRGAAAITKAFHLQQEGSQVVVRFSDFTGLPAIPDTHPSANPRGLSIKFKMADGQTTDIVGHSFNGFPTSNSDDFRLLLLSIAHSGADAVKPTELDRFLETHPIARAFLTTQHTPASFGAITYFGVNSFQFTNAKGEMHFIRYQFIPESGEELLTPEQVAARGPDYLQEEIRARIAQHTIRYKMYAQLAEKGDDIKDPSIAWPDSRKKVLLGVIEIKNLAANTEAEDKALTFTPVNIPDGIKPADPMIEFRGRAYPISVRERQ
jgi:catalase